MFQRLFICQQTTSTNETHFHSPWSVASGQQNLTLSVSLCTQSLVLIYLLLIEYPCSVLCCLNCCCFCLLLHPQPVEALLEQIHSFHASSSVSCDTNICFLRFRCYPPLSTTGVAGRCSYSIRGIWIYTMNIVFYGLWNRKHRLTYIFKVVKNQYENIRMIIYVYQALTPKL